MDIKFQIVLALLLGAITSLSAYLRGRSPVLWFFLGTFFGIFGLIALFIMPYKTKKEEPIKKVTPLVQGGAKMPPELYKDFEKWDWYYLDKEKQTQGPSCLSEMKKLFEEGVLSQDSWVWSSSLKEWKKIIDVSPLYLWFQQNESSNSTL
jgi:hypothetical protein